MSAAPDAREMILGRIRETLSESRSLFRSEGEYGALPDPPTPVVSLGGPAQQLALEFGAQLEKVNGSYEIVEHPDDVAPRVAELTRAYGGDGPQHEVLSWAPERLPVPHLRRSLSATGIQLFVPEDLHDTEARARSARAKVGLTGVDAAFAATGSVVLRSGPGKPRAASLLPLHHIVLVPLRKLYPAAEAWVQELRETGRVGEFFSSTAQVVVVTGPSKSADIELNLTLGVHGPRVMHALVFDDGEEDRRIRA